MKKKYFSDDSHNRRYYTGGWDNETLRILKRDKISSTALSHDPCLLWKIGVK